MKRFLLSVNCVSALLFAGFFAYTFLGREHIRTLATDYIVEKLEPGANKSVQLAETILQTPAINSRLKEEHLQAALAEIDEFHSAPHQYIQSLADPRSPAINSRAASGIAADLATKINGWKQAIRHSFDRTYERIVIDLRIFGFSNLAAACAAIYLICRFGAHRKIMVICILLMVSLAYSIFMYIDQLWFFRILVGSFMGVWYPIGMLIIFVCLYRDFARDVELAIRNTNAHPESSRSRPTVDG
jgi:hypothetical protein